MSTTQDDGGQCLVLGYDRTIVVGCEQHSRLHKALGTVTSELLKSSPVPVTAVPSRAA